MKKLLTAAFIILLTISSASALAAETGSIEADKLSYNVKTKHAAASGNVIFTRGRDTLKGGRAEGNIDRQITVTGNVRGNFASRRATLSAAKVIWTEERDGKKTDCITAQGNVILRQGKDNYLKAPFVKVNADRKKYEASGGMEALYNNKYIKAEKITRDGENFKGTSVSKLEDREKKYSIAAREITGTIHKDEEISTAVAEGSVSVNNTDKNGIKSRINGDKAIYNKTEGTLIITGNVNGIREDGKTIKADKITYNINDRQLEATGRARITFINENK